MNNQLTPTQRVEQAIDEVWQNSGEPIRTAIDAAIKKGDNKK